MVPVTKTEFMPRMQALRPFSGTTPQPPTCLIQEDGNEFQILLKMRGRMAHELKLFLSQDRKRLHLLAENKDGAEGEQFLWSFQLPKTADRDDIQVDHQDSLYLVHIPKKRLLRKIKALTPVAVRGSRSFAS